MPQSTLLVVEDDEMVRAFVCSVLKSDGYHVLAAGDGMEALDIAASFGLSRIDLVLTDVDLPSLDGVTLVRHLKRLRPDLKTLYMTGQLGHLGEELEDGCTVLEKPFGHTTLLRRLRVVLWSGR